MNLLVTCMLFVVTEFSLIADGRRRKPANYLKYQDCGKLNSIANFVETSFQLIFSFMVFLYMSPIFHARIMLHLSPSFPHNHGLTISVSLIESAHLCLPHLLFRSDLLNPLHSHHPSQHSHLCSFKQVLLAISVYPGPSSIHYSSSDDR